MRWMVAGPTFSGALESITNITFQQRERQLPALDKEKIVYKKSNCPCEVEWHVQKIRWVRCNLKAVLRIRVRDPGSSAFLTHGSGIRDG
jgi:hypothetical protein